MQNSMVNPMDMQMNAPMMNQMDMMNMQMGDPMMMNQMDMMNMQMGDPMMMNQMDMMNMQMGYPMMDPMGMQFANFNMADYQPGEINGPHINGFEQFQGEIQPVDYSDDYAINVDMQTLDQDVPTQTGTHEVEGAGKVVAFIGTSKNGTSFLADSVGMLFSQAGIKTAIVDTTKNKNSSSVNSHLSRTIYSCGALGIVLANVQWQRAIISRSFSLLLISNIIIPNLRLHFFSFSSSSHKTQSIKTPPFLINSISARKEFNCSFVRSLFSNLCEKT